MPDTTTGERPEVPRLADAQKDSLAGKIQSSFDAVMGTDDAEDTPAEESAETSATEQEAESNEATPEQEAAEASTETETTDETATEEAAPAKPAGPTLPAAYVRSLKALEWTDEEIAEAAKNPAFITTAAKLHTSRNKEVAEWARIGRESKKQQETQPRPEAQQAPALKPVDLKALKAKYGDEVVDDILGPVNATIEQVMQILPIVQQTQIRAQQAQLEQLGRQIDGFFAGKDMEPYKDQYGVNTANLTEQQLAARTKVLEFADALVGGARSQGRNLTTDQALQMAHDAVSGETKVQTARKQITQQLQTRNKGITLKPGSRGTSVSKPGTRSDLEKRVKQGLASVLGA